MEKKFSFTFKKTIQQSIDPSGNVEQQLSLALSGLRGNIEQELSKALSGIGVSSSGISQELSETLSRSVEEQISQALSGMRNREIQNTPCESVTMPSGQSANFSCIAPDHNSGLTITTEEYRTIESEMQNTIVDHYHCRTFGGCFSKYDIISIQKLYNTSIFEEYVRIKAEVIEEHGSANEHMLFHGSPYVPDIKHSGFSTSWANPGGLFGAGIYFAKHSSKSNQYVFGLGKGCPTHGDANCSICERQLLFCRVILGNEYTVTKSMKVSSLPDGYHSLKGIEGGPRGLRYPEYVIYKGKQAYPEYIITYKIVE